MKFNRVIWKYKIRPGEFSLEVSGKSKFVSVDVDPRGQPSVWLEVDPAEPTHEMKFKCVPTGQTFSNIDWTAIGSFVLRDEGLVYHLLIARPDAFRERAHQVFQEDPDV